MPRRQTLVLLGILTLGALLRFWTLAEGLPYLSGSDEPVIFGHVARMLKTGDLHPGIFDYGGFIFYFHLAIAGAGWLAGSVLGTAPPLATVSASDLFLWGRIATAVLSVLTIYVVYLAASRWGTAVGLLAATAMAVQPQLVREAHFGLTDTPLVLFVALALLFSLRAAETGGARDYALAGIAVGLAAGTKYPGGLAGLMPLAAVITTAPVTRWAGIGAVVAGAAAATFLLVAPYTVIDFQGFSAGMQALQGSYNQPSSFAIKADTYRKYLQDWFGLAGTLPRSWTWPATVTTLIGLGAMASGVRARAARALAAIVLVFPIAYFVFIANQSLSFGRYAMPLIPVVSLGLAAGMVRIYDVVARRAPSAAGAARALLLLLFLPPLLSSVSFNRERAPVDTLEHLTAWMDRTVRPGEPFVIEERYIPFTLPERRFTFRRVARLTEEPLDTYRRDGVVYLIWVNWERDDVFKDPSRFGAEIAAYNQLLRDTELVEAFTPSPGQHSPAVRILRVSR